MNFILGIVMSRAAPDLLETIRAGLLGADAVIDAPFGPRRLIYADYTASGRALGFVEAAIARALTAYANTHTETSFTGMQTTRLREGARATIRAAVGADDRHAVVFCGSGATAAIARLVRAMGLDRPASEGPRPIVFIGPYEHHSNELVWREAAVDLVRVPLDGGGHLDFGALEVALAHHADRPVKIGSFSAASNVTGIVTDIRRLSALLHRHGAWVFADYAAGGPYLPIEMTESAPGAGDGLDAIFLSPHKFVGGPGASGVLVADRRLLANPVPSVPGGGTVAYVDARMHRYVADPERREEAGTPAILGDIRAGLVLALKADVGPARIAELERSMVGRVLAAAAEMPGIELLGPRDPDRLAIFSFNVRHGNRVLHPNFVVALLNDLFGIQARGGCSCAGPYAHDLLGISHSTATGYDGLLRQGLSVFRPGWVRLNINYFFDEEMVEAILSAMRFIARRGADLLPLYACDTGSGRWRAVGHAPPAAMEVSDLCLWRPTARPSPGEPVPCPPFSACLALAEQLADTGRRMPAAGPAPELDRDERWFALACDAA